MGLGKISTHWKVDGTAIYEPANDTQIDHESIQSSDTGRTEDGIMHIDWVRRNMVKVHMTWRYLTGQEVATLEKLLQGKEFTLSYYDKGETKTATVYVSTLSYKKVTDALYSNEGGLYSDISANAIEI